MPLLKRKAFCLLDPPKDLDPDQKIWQIRFTKEVFTDYQEYLERVNLFRKRVWTCNSTGRMHLTYEEALVSEREAREKIMQIPQDFSALVLKMVQFSMLKMNDLVTEIVEKLRDTFTQGEELNGKLENSGRRCKIMKVLVRNGRTCYEVGWLGESREAMSTTIEEKDKLARQKLPFSKGLLKLFIKESTFQNSPWLVHNNLAKEYGIPIEPPKELREKIANNQEMMAAKKKRINPKDGESTTENVTKKTKSGGCMEDQLCYQVKYPIEDSLVKPSADDPVFTLRPVPSINFVVPMENVGNLLMVWDFLSCFGKVLRLSPFSLDDFEDAITYESDTNLVAEVHTSILSLLINDHAEYHSLIQQKKRKEKVTTKIWVQYLCDFLEMDSITKSKDHLAKIKNGNYSGLSVHVKLEILNEMVHCANLTEAVRGKIDKNIEQQQSLMASKREEDLEELRKRREDKRLKGTKSDDERSKEPSDSTNQHVPTDMGEVGDVTVLSSVENKHQDNSVRCFGDVSKLDVLASRRALMKQSVESKISAEKEKEALRMQELQKLREESKARKKEARERKLRKLRLELFEREMEKLHIWTDPLGTDRDHNRYWFFQRDGRVFVESADHNLWGYYSSKEELDALMGSLNPKGKRELELQRHLERDYPKICSAFHKRSKEMAIRVRQEDTSVFRRSVRVSALPKDESNTPSFLRYVNKLKR
ncbi:DDT domain-containing protein [Iris pallida]|uniref:DDT domain-containing protein n=1 Tax=Iris pallida TaxID=29817 RepID=A0AAX6FE94_IRIPA|nr:DDT domain-containing protein [Iris pallida]